MVASDSADRWAVSGVRSEPGAHDRAMERRGLVRFTVSESDRTWHYRHPPAGDHRQILEGHRSANLLGCAAAILFPSALVQDFRIQSADRTPARHGLGLVCPALLGSDCAPVDKRCRHGAVSHDLNCMRLPIRVTNRSRANGRNGPGAGIPCNLALSRASPREPRVGDSDLPTGCRCVRTHAPDCRSAGLCCLVFPDHVP